ncbi:MAG: hypothetical protein QJR04_25100 [Burkholderia multivorans]|nr:hypothetical protein [Burkholderia multivorans]
MNKFNGHKNWNHWNVSLWINNDEALYNLARDCIRANMSRVHSNRDKAARDMLNTLEDMGITHTPDGAPYSVSSIRAAMRGMQ